MTKPIPTGYKQTKVGVIPDDWEVVKVGEVCDSIVPGRNKPANFNGIIPWITTPDITSKHIYDTKSNLYITIEEAKKIGSKIVPKNSVIMSCVGELGLLSLTQKEIVINQQLHAFLPSSKIQTEFLYYTLSLQKSYMDSVATKTSVPYMNKNNCNSIPIPLPPIKEQEKIAEILSTWDDAIIKQEQLIEQKQVFKRGIMQQIFSQELRFKGDNSNDYPAWDYLELSDLLTYKQPTKYLVSSKDYCDDYKIPVLTAGKSFILGYTNETSGIFRENLPVIIFDDFTTSNQFVNFKFKVKSSAMKILLPATDKVNIRYIYERMQFIDFALGDEHKRYWISEYSREVIEVPSSEEQNKIADFLTSFDDEITKQTEILEQLKLQKQSLMQKLLTGQVRVKI